MSLGERKKIILKAVVDDYIEHAEPVGSRTLADKLSLGLSSATLRNEMSELESLGYLEQPHTSAGRIPSNKGYRLYVDELMEPRHITAEEAEDMERALHGRLREIDRMVADVARMLADLTSYAVYAGAVRPEGIRFKKAEIIPIDGASCVVVAVFSANVVKNTVMARPPELDIAGLQRLTAAMNDRLFDAPAEELTVTVAMELSKATDAPPEFVCGVVDFIRTAAVEYDRTSVYVDGATHIFDHPEYRDVFKARRLLDYLFSDTAMLPAPEERGGVKILIGPENVSEELRDSSVVVASYELGDGMHGLIGVVGPTRMKYSDVASRLGFFTRRLGSLFGRSDSPDQHEKG